MSFDEVKPAEWDLAHRLIQEAAESESRVALTTAGFSTRTDQEVESVGPFEPTTAPEILQQAVAEMLDRAVTYDAKDGERSIGKTVAAYRAIKGDGLMESEEDGWLFMEVLKLVRSVQGNFKMDNYVDAAAYAALRGESARMERGPEL